MSVELITFRRIHCILNQLRKGPASKATLLGRVNCRLADAYGPTDTRKGISRFEHDLSRLRDLGVIIEYKAGEYHLVSVEAIDTL